jgi:hypothetical protein
VAFKKGQSGTPQGRPKGLTDRRTALRELLEPHAEKLVRKAVAMAVKGDVAALSLCISRLIPPAKSAPVPLGDCAGDVAQQAESVVAAMMAGVMTVDDAQGMMAVIQGRAKILETAELERRIAELENAHGNAGNENRAA